MLLSCQFVHGLNNPCNKPLTCNNASHYLLEPTSKIFQPCGPLSLGCLTGMEPPSPPLALCLLTIYSSSMEGPRNRSAICRRKLTAAAEISAGCEYSAHLPERRHHTSLPPCLHVPWGLRSRRLKVERHRTSEDRLHLLHLNL